MKDEWITNYLFYLAINKLTSKADRIVPCLFSHAAI
jgi:hypothetical protein